MVGTSLGLLDFDVACHTVAPNSQIKCFLGKRGIVSTDDVNFTLLLEGEEQPWLEAWIFYPISIIREVGRKEKGLVSD